MREEAAASLIAGGQAVLGIEFGSTRIKGVLADREGEPLAAGAHGWENSFEGGVWTYGLDEAWAGLADCYASLAADSRKRYGVVPTKLAACGFSGMMHGYIALDEDGELLAPFRTWRNNITGEAAAKLTTLFDFAIPQRWSIAHLYQSILEAQAHVKDIAYLTTLAGYVHWKLTGEFAVGIGEASGMFPIDSASMDYDEAMVRRFDAAIAQRGYKWRLRDILPRVLGAGAEAGRLSPAGARLVDPTGALTPGIPLCPPEGDAGTGMVATNSVRPRTGNVSAGTSVFAMLVLESGLSRARPEIDMVVTPDGKPVAMAHSNNCSSDLDAWMAVFGQAARLMGAEFTKAELYDRVLRAALSGGRDAGGLVHIGYVSGEHLTGFTEGRPLFARRPGDEFSLENAARSLLYSSLCALRIGLDILVKEEGVRVDEIRGHGGFFKTPDVGQRVMAAATGIPVSIPASAGEGGAWGMALLAAFMLRADPAQGLADFLDSKIAGSVGAARAPESEDLAGFEEYLRRYRACLPVEAAAVAAMKRENDKETT